MEMRIEITFIFFCQRDSHHFSTALIGGNRRNPVCRDVRNFLFLSPPFFFKLVIGIDFLKRIRYLKVRSATVVFTVVPE